MCHPNREGGHVGLVATLDGKDSRVPASPPRAQAAPSDADLLARSVAGERRAADMLIARHLTWVVRLAQGRLRSLSEAEDVAQEVFLTVWQKGDQWQADKAKFTTWLYTITVNRCTDALRRRRPNVDLEAVSDTLQDKTAGAFATLADKERRAALLGALAQLPPAQRSALELVYFNEWSQKDAAAALGVTQAALESNLRRARQKLQSLLFDRKDELLGEPN